MKAQGSSKIMEITESNQGITGDIFCKKSSSMMRPRTAKHIKQCWELRMPDMEGPWWLSQSKRVPLDTLDSLDLDPTAGIAAQDRV